MKKILNKLSSRKLWISLGAVVGCVLTAICGEPDNATQIVAVVGAVASAISYVLGEASIDRAAVGCQPDEPEPDVIGFAVDENIE